VARDEVEPQPVFGEEHVVHTMFAATGGDAEKLRRIGLTVSVRVADAVEARAVDVRVQGIEGPHHALGARYVYRDLLNLHLRGIGRASDTNAEDAGGLLIGCVKAAVWSDGQRHPGSLGLKRHVVEMLHVE